MRRFIPKDEISVDRGIIEAEPTIFVFLLLHSLHFEIYFEWPTLESKFLVHVYKRLSVFEFRKAYKAIGQNRPLNTLPFFRLPAIKIFEMSHCAILFDKLLHNFLRQVAFKSRDVYQIPVALIKLILLF